MVRNIVQGRRFFCRRLIWVHIPSPRPYPFTLQLINREKEEEERGKERLYSYSAIPMVEGNAAKYDTSVKYLVLF